MNRMSDDFYAWNAIRQAASKHGWELVIIRNHDTWKEDIVATKGGRKRVYSMDRDPLNSMPSPLFISTMLAELEPKEPRKAARSVIQRRGPQRIKP